MPMKVELHKGSPLPADLVTAWVKLQQSSVELQSPFLRPEFTSAVAAVRPDVEVAVLHDGGRAAGFFPFQRSKWNVGRPVGSRLSDLHAFLVAPELNWDPVSVVRGCKLAVLDFHVLLSTHERLSRFSFQFAQCAYIDLSDGFEAYRAGRRQAGSEKTKQAAKLARRAERDIGALRFEADSRDPEVMRQLLAWKSQRYRATGAWDVLALPWVLELIHLIRSFQDEAFCALVSALYFGERLAAVEMGLRSHGVLHGWFSTYNPALAKYSPGTLLQIELARAAPSLGLRRLELGKNNLRYKASFASGTYPVLKGSIAIHPWWWAMRQGRATLQRLADVPVLSGSRQMARRVFAPARDWLALR